MNTNKQDESVEVEVEEVLYEVEVGQTMLQALVKGAGGNADVVKAVSSVIPTAIDAGIEVLNLSNPDALLPKGKDSKATARGKRAVLGLGSYVKGVSKSPTPASDVDANTPLTLARGTLRKAIGGNKKLTKAQKIKLLKAELEFINAE